MTDTAATVINDQTKQALLKKLDELPFSTRAKNCFMNAGLGTLVGDLVQVTEKYLLDQYNFSKRSLNDVKQILADMNLTLGMTLQGWPEAFLDDAAPAVEAVKEEETTLDFDAKWPDFNKNLLRPIPTVAINSDIARVFGRNNIKTVGDLAQITRNKSYELIESVERRNADHYATAVSTQLNKYGLGYGTEIPDWPQQIEAYDAWRESLHNPARIPAIIANSDLNPAQQWEQIVDTLLEDYAPDEYTERALAINDEISDAVLEFTKANPAVVGASDASYKKSLNKDVNQLLDACLTNARQNDFDMSAQYLFRTKCQDDKNAIIRLMSIPTSTLTPMHAAMAIAIIKTGSTRGLSITEAKAAYMDGYVNDESTKQIHEGVTKSLEETKPYLEAAEYTRVFDKMLLDRIRDANKPISDKECRDAFKKVANVVRTLIPTIEFRAIDSYGPTAEETRFVIHCKR